MATLDKIAQDVKILLNRPDLFAAAPSAGQLDIRLIYSAINTVIRDLTLEEDFRATEVFFDIDNLSAQSELPFDFQKFESLWYTDSDRNEMYEITRMPFAQALHEARTRRNVSYTTEPSELVVAIYGQSLRIFPTPSGSDDGGLRLYYLRFLPSLEAEEENYFTRNFDGFLTHASAVHILKTSIQPRGDFTAIYDFERLTKNLKDNILQSEARSKGTAA